MLYIWCLKYLLNIWCKICAYWTPAPPCHYELMYRAPMRAKNYRRIKKFANFQFGNDSFCFQRFSPSSHQVDELSHKYQRQNKQLQVEASRKSFTICEQNFGWMELFLLMLGKEEQSKLPPWWARLSRQCVLPIPCLSSDWALFGQTFIIVFIVLLSSLSPSKSHPFVITE